jgi:hypothetical protein
MLSEAYHKGILPRMARMLANDASKHRKAVALE